MRVGNVVDGQGHTPAVGTAAPGGAGELPADGGLPVNLGESVGFRAAVVGVKAQEQAGILGQRCQQGETPAGLALFAPHLAHVGCSTQGQRLGVAAHHGLVAEPQRTGAQRPGGQLQRQVGFDFQLVAITAAQVAVQRQAIGFDRYGRACGAHSPGRRAVFEQDGVAVAARVGSVVPGAVCHESPVVELAARVLGVGVGVKVVEQRIVAHHQRPASRAGAAADLVETGFDGLILAAGIPALQQEQAGPVGIDFRPGGACQLAVGQAAGAGQARQRLTFGGLRIQVQLGALPQAQADVGRGGERIGALLQRAHAVGPVVGRMKSRFGLPDESGLAVKRPPGRLVRRLCLQSGAGRCEGNSKGRGRQEAAEADVKHGKLEPTMGV